MDLPDVRAAVQRQATCGMCNFWQRFGRVARETGKEGTGILFYEKVHLDDSHKRKKANTQTKKRKAIEDGGRSAKWPATDSTFDASSSSNQVIPSDVPEIEMVDLAVAARQMERKVSYTKPTSKETAKKAKTMAGDNRREVDICGLLNDFIHARKRDEVFCRRSPVKLYSDGPIRILGEFSKAGLTLCAHSHITALDDHHLCNEFNPSGFNPCAPHPSFLCCDICNSEHSDKLFISPSPAKAPQGPN